MSPGTVVTLINGMWDFVDDDVYITERTKVPGGWLLRMYHQHHVTREQHPAPVPIFIADPYHTWIFKESE